MGLSKQDHLDPAKGPKRILALDGGGIRGILTLEFLKNVETLLKQRLGDDALICDYFDLIGGTSTGSILAAGLACGKTVGALQELYRNIGANVFQPGGLAKFLPESFQGVRAVPPSRCNRSSTGSSARTRRSIATRSAPGS